MNLNLVAIISTPKILLSVGSLLFHQFLNRILDPDVKKMDPERDKNLLVTFNVIEII